MATNSYIQKVGGYIKYGRKLIPNIDGGGALDGGYSLMTGKLTLKKSGSGSVTVSFINVNSAADCLVPDYATANTSGIDITDVAVIDGIVCVRQQSIASPVVTGDGVASFVNVTDSGKYFTVISVNDPTKDILVVF